jgi:hypothetical protein
MEDWSRRVNSFVASLRGVLPEEALQDPARLIEHSEAGEGLRILACNIVAGGLKVPRSILRELHELGDGLVDDWPEGLDSHSGE